ncbi:MAG: PIN domain-containing protein [Spirochaetales bacterium]|nr:PIN domain-containing protein [Spirochaetales bacterium]
MACYYDSSFIIAAILNNEENINFLEIWDKDPIRLSSTILKIECIISIRRLGMSDVKRDEEWEKKSINTIKDYFPYITFRKCDEEIEKLIMEDNRFSLCRTLDAIHIASAFYFKPYLKEDIIICTLDKRMRQTAQLLDFKIYPPI